VQLIVEVAGLCSSAPAFEVTRPAGIAPRRSAHRKPFAPVLLLFRPSFPRRPTPWRYAGSVVDARIDRFALLGFEAVFLVPDIVGGCLQRNLRRAATQSFKAHSAHFLIVLPVSSQPILLWFSTTFWT
jgi:hypothetical protein